MFTLACFNMSLNMEKVRSPCECTGEGKCGNGEVRCECGEGCGHGESCECPGNNTCGTGVMKCECKGDGVCGHSVLVQCECGGTGCSVCEPGDPPIECQVVGDKCSTCEQSLSDMVIGSLLPCKGCKNTFHVHGCSAKEYANKTLAKAVSANSTKSNFMFFCDPCKCEFENWEADVGAKRLARLEQQFAKFQQFSKHQICSVSAKLDSLLKGSVTSVAPSAEVQASPASPKSTPQSKSNSQSYASKTKPSRPMATIKILPKPGTPGPRINVSAIGDIANTESIPVFRTASDSKGNVFVTVPETLSKRMSTALESSTKPDPLAEPSDGDGFTVQGKKPSPAIIPLHRHTPSIILVGLSRSHEKSEILDIVKRVNEPLANLLTPETFKVYAVKKTRNRDDTFQCFVNVSDEVRRAVKENGDWLYFGANTLQVYDNFFIKRCNKCQLFHHFEGTCRKPVCCGICAGDHHLNSCPHSEDITKFKCTNCSKAGLASNHRAYDSSCHSYKKEQEKLKSRIDYYNSA